MIHYQDYLDKAEETSVLAARTQNPVLRRTLQDMESVYRTLAQIAAPAEPAAPAGPGNAPLHGALAKSPDRH